MKELLNTYYPIEIDPHRTAEEKLPLMVEWWETITGSEFEGLSLIRQCWNSCKASFSLLLLLPSVGGHKSTSCWLNRESGKTCWPRLSGNPGRCWGICWKCRPGRADAFFGRDRLCCVVSIGTVTKCFSTIWRSSGFLCWSSQLASETFWRRWFSRTASSIPTFASSPTTWTLTRLWVAPPLGQLYLCFKCSESMSK